MATISQHINSVRQLRKEQLVTSTREFKARGALLKRCPECLLAEDQCICNSVEPVDMDIAVCMLMYHGEYYKPSNTGQLICEIAKDNYAFRWQRTEQEPALKELLEDEKWFPVIIFPHDNVEKERQLNQLPEKADLGGKRPLFIFLDGTWRQAKKMFVKSPYLQNISVLQVSDINKGNYQLREAYHDHHLSTVEVAIELFRCNNQEIAAQALNDLFLRFRNGYKIYKR